MVVASSVALRVADGKDFTPEKSWGKVGTHASHLFQNLLRPFSEDLPDEGMIDRWEFFFAGHVGQRTTGTLTELTWASWSIPPLEMHLAFPVIEISIGNGNGKQ